MSLRSKKAVTLAFGQIGGAAQEIATRAKADPEFEAALERLAQTCPIDGESTLDLATAQTFLRTVMGWAYRGEGVKRDEPWPTRVFADALTAIEAESRANGREAARRLVWRLCGADPD